MAKLGLEIKYNEEVSRSDNEREELILKQKAQIDALTARFNAVAVECEELKEEIAALKLLKEKISDLKDYM